MNRKDFLRLSGLAGAASLIPTSKINFETKKQDPDTCTLIPSETTGPYPLDLSNDSTYFRNDIREDQVGALTKVTLKIFDVNSCTVVQDARVDLWHCNAYGYYSGYTTNGQNGNINYGSEKWLRGIQMTDANGEVSFTTIFPGWYSGRVTHMHFQIYFSSMLQVTSQLTVPVAEKNALYASNEPYSQYGDDPQTLASDNVFSDGYALQMATLTYNDTTEMYEVFLEVGVIFTNLGLLQMEPETGGQFGKLRNYPNPYQETTTIFFELYRDADIRIDFYDLMGRKVGEIIKTGLSVGEQHIAVDISALSLEAGNYLYQLHVENDQGEFKQCKMMTAKKL